jgi:hypothetical protein
MLAAVARAETAPRVCSFHSAAEVQSIKVTRASVRHVAARGTAGEYALEARFESGEESRIEIPLTTSDWRGYGSLVMDATNTSLAPVRFSFEARDKTGAATKGRTWSALAPAQRVLLALSMDAPLPEKMGMQAEPPIEPFRALWADHLPVDLTRMESIAIFMNKLAEPRTMVFSEIRLGPAVSYEKISDRFGQYTRADWPGRVKDEADLRSQSAAEQAELKARPALPERDEYGGWAAGPKLKATGYFRTEKHDGKWWLVTPGGHLFFSVGLDTVSVVEGSTIVEGRERMFEWLPGEGQSLAGHYQSIKSWLASEQEPLHRAFNFYTANLERKYGKDWYASWQAITLARLPAWGFNTIGNWSDPRLCDMKEIPYVGTLEVHGEMQRISGIPPFADLRIYDTFDPRFAPAVDQSVRALALERRDDPWLIGYFVDNELPWGFMQNERTRYALALAVLSLGPGSPAKRALVAQLKTRHGGIDQFNAAWHAHLTSWDELLQKPYQLEGELTAASRRDMSAFVTEFALRYFRTIRETLKKYDPNHLYLGCRFAWLVNEDSSWTTPEVEDVAARYCDVISFNVYLPRIDSRWDFLKRLGKPAIIGEFNFGAPDTGMFNPGVAPTSSQVERARMFQAYMRSVAGNPAFVGCHWFQYIDEPTTGRDDGENINTGIVTITDTAYPEMVIAAKAVNAQVYQLRNRRAN